MPESDPVHIIGDGPPAEAVTAALSDIDRTPSHVPQPDPAARLTVVIDTAGAAVFNTANQSLHAPWIAVELGGIGGHPHPDIDVAVSAFSTATSCFDCLRARVAANDPPSAPSPPTTTKRDARLGGAYAGRLATSILTQDSVPESVTELPYANRHRLPVPTCACADSPTHIPSRDHIDRALEDTLDRAERAIDDRIGLVQSIGEPHSFPLPYYLASLCDTSAFSDATAPPHAAGAAIDWNHAFMKAIGEALERYAAATYRTETLTTATPSDRPTGIPPSRFVRPSDTHVPDPETPIQWVPGTDLATTETVSLPAEFVYFPPPTHDFRPPITTGLGLGISSATALLAGLYEVIERDATMLAWYSTFEPLELTVTDPQYTDLLHRATSEQLDVTALLVTQDIDIPVITACVHRSDDWPRFAVGASANIRPEIAARSALEEALQNWMELRAMGPEAASEEPSAIARYADYPPEADDFIATTRVIDAETLAPTRPPESPPAELDAVIDRVTASDLTPYASGLTTQDLDRLGFAVVRVVIPTAQPLFIGTPFFGDRASTVPGQLGFKPRLDRPPHPYP